MLHRMLAILTAGVAAVLLIDAAPAAESTKEAPSFYYETMDMDGAKQIETMSVEQSLYRRRELLNAQKAAKADGPFTRMVARQSELARIQNRAQGHGQGLDGESLVELITLREQIQRHALHVRQQEAWSAAVALFQRINEKISQELGLDFASNAAPRRGGCCG